MTEIIRTVSQMSEIREQLLAQNKTVGLVPTMGYLHAGHQSLIKLATQENDIVIVSDFLNPLQFGPSEDLSKYPRDLDKDLVAVSDAGADYLFYPSASQMYGDDFLSGDQVLTTIIPPKTLTNTLCGLKRPGHFEGVCTVVAKLLNITRPTHAYFGQKDAQQLVIIKRMVQDLNMNVKIISCPTVREADGLALSSRNIYLNPTEREAALVLSKSLNLAKEYIGEAFNIKKEIKANAVIKQINALISAEPLAKIDYISLVDPYSLEDLVVLKRGEQALLALAVFVGEDVHKTRLIDNTVLYCK